jgi:hypothetical protein
MLPGHGVVLSERAIHSTEARLDRNGPQKSGIPDEMRPHAH